MKKIEKENIYINHKVKIIKANIKKRTKTNKTNKQKKYYNNNNKIIINIINQ